MNYRQYLIRLFTFLGGIYFFFEYVLPAEMRLPAFLGGESIKFGAYHQEISNGFIVISAMSIGLGLFNLLYIHCSAVALRRKGMLNSVSLLLGLALMLAVTFQDWMASEKVSGYLDQFQNTELFVEYIVQKKASPGQDVPPQETRVKFLLADLEKLFAVSEGIQASPISQRVPKESLSFQLASSTDQNLRDEIGVAKALAAGLSSISDSAEATAERLKELAASLTKARTLLQSLLDLQYKESTQRQIYNLFYEGIFVALGSAMFSLLGFYIAAAAYRAFRVRSMESSLMMTAALLVMLGQIPFGVWVWDSLPELRLWILRVPNSAAFRGVAIGAMIAGLIAAFRMWFSIESEGFSAGSAKR